MNKLFVFRILFDFGLVVLIWIVQLIIYPSFKFYNPSELVLWHPIYTKAISLVVIPLMLGQVGVVSLQLIKTRNFYTILSMIGVLVVWALTFLIFVPIHNAISNGVISDTNLNDLVNYNWLRSLIWSGIFSLNLMPFEQKIN